GCAARPPPERPRAWDAGCGNGQATIALARHFDHVTGTDPSANQIAQAEAHAGVDYRAEPAESTSLADASGSAVTVAPALPWFDQPRFHDEVRRVARPDAIVAAWAYAHCDVADAAIDRAIERLYVDLTGAHWPPERADVEVGYAQL